MKTDTTWRYGVVSNTFVHRIRIVFRVTDLIYGILAISLFAFVRLRHFVARQTGQYYESEIDRLSR